MIQHLACIMDGNRRWAKKNGWLPWLGHQYGVEAVRTAVHFCLENGISFLSLYTFSLENFKRSSVEKDYLFLLLNKMITKELAELVKQGVRVRFIGDRTLFPDVVSNVCNNIEQKTAHLTKLNLTFLFCYGARQEIVSGIKQLMKKVKAGMITEDDISEDTFAHYLWTHGLPDPDLIIRTGGLKRLSNFLLYQAAYSEFYFLDCLWPELTEAHLEKAIKSFKHCKRNFGT